MVGIVFVMHGQQKLFEMGVGGVSGFFASLGVPAPQVAAVVVSLLETIGGVALILGVLTRLFGLLLTGDMLVALLLVHRPNGFFVGTVASSWCFSWAQRLWPWRLPARARWRSTTCCRSSGDSRRCRRRLQGVASAAAADCDPLKPRSGCHPLSAAPLPERSGSPALRGPTARQPWYDVPRTAMTESGNLGRRAADPASEEPGF